MKVLVLTTVRFKRNGISTVILQYYQRMKDSISFDFVCSEYASEDILHELSENGSNVYVLPKRRKNPIAYAMRIRKICRANKYDIVHIHGNSETMSIELVGAWLGGVKTRIVHSHAVKPKHEKMARVLRPLFNVLYTSGLACSKEAGVSLFKEKTFNVVPNAFDVQKYAYNDSLRWRLREEFGFGDSTVVIGYVAVFAPVKNHAFLIDVFEEYLRSNSNAHLVLVGDGAEKDNIVELTKTNKIDSKVSFLGERNDVQDILNAFDCVLFPSLSEGLGISILEAEANGLPVIANKDGISDIVKVNHNFVFLHMGNIIEWSNALKKIDLTREKNGYENISEAGFDIVKQAELLMEYYIQQLSLQKHRHK